MRTGKSIDEIREEEAKKREFKAWGEKNIRLGLWNREDFNSMLAGTYRYKLTQEQEEKYLDDLEGVVDNLEKVKDKFLKITDK
jgi:hypothetical protein